MKAFICNQCGYRFTSAKEEWRQPCPYCGKKSVQHEKDAHALLEEERE